MEIEGENFGSLAAAVAARNRFGRSLFALFTRVCVCVWQWELMYFGSDGSRGRCANLLADPVGLFVNHINSAAFDMCML